MTPIDQIPTGHHHWLPLMATIKGSLSDSWMRWIISGLLTALLTMLLLDRAALISRVAHVEADHRYMLQVMAETTATLDALRNNQARVLTQLDALQLELTKRR